MEKAGLMRALWLIGTLALLPAFVWAEVMNFRVYFGAIPAGKLWFEANQDDKGAYTIRASLEDALPWLTFEDELEATGVRKGKVFMAQRYDLKLRENDYRADKVVAFDRKKNVAVYTNRLDASDPQVTTPIGAGVSDALSTLWTLRQEPAEAFAKPRTMQAVGLKRVVNLTVQAAGLENVKVKGKHDVAGFDGRTQRLQRIDITVTETDQPNKSELWQVWVKPGSQPMEPVVFATKTKLGKFWAYLQ